MNIVYQVLMIISCMYVSIDQIVASHGVSSRPHVDAYRKVPSTDRTSSMSHESPRTISHDVVSLHQDIINFIDNPESLAPDYIPDQKNNAEGLDISHDVRRHFIAAGGQLTAQEYAMFKDFQETALKGGQKVEAHIRHDFIQAVVDGNIQKALSCVDIDWALRHQSVLGYREPVEYGPLMTSMFEHNLTALHYAVMSNNPDMMRCLLDISSLMINERARFNALKVFMPYDAVAYKPSNPLDYAILYRLKPDLSLQDRLNNNQVIELLLSKGAKVSDVSMQKLLHDYIAEKIPPKIVPKRRTTIYESMKSLFGSNGSVQIAADA